MGSHGWKCQYSVLESSTAAKRKMREVIGDLNLHSKSIMATEIFPLSLTCLYRYWYYYLSPSCTMRLLTHNTLRNNSAEADGNGFPLKITCTEIRVDNDGNGEGSTAEDEAREVAFVKGILGILDWPALVQVRSWMLNLQSGRKYVVLWWRCMCVGYRGEGTRRLLLARPVSAMKYLI